jgi:hypothetical protein
MLSFSISYSNLVKIPYFVDTTEREDRWRKQRRIGGEREGDFMDNSNVCFMIGNAQRNGTLAGA